jgi:hypothetical protein
MLAHMASAMMITKKAKARARAETVIGIECAGIDGRSGAGIGTGVAAHPSSDESMESETSCNAHRDGE